MADNHTLIEMYKMFQTIIEFTDAWDEYRKNAEENAYNELSNIPEDMDFDFNFYAKRVVKALFEFLERSLWENELWKKWRSWLRKV